MHYTLLADDAAGVLGVNIVSNEDVAVDMPFMPFGDGTPASFLSGNFMGDGGPYSDRLYRLALSGYSYTNAFFSAEDGWVDPATGMPTGMTAVRGDTLVFAPGDEVGLDFWLFGRVPGLAPNSGLPRIRSMSVSPDDGTIDLEILAKGRTTDIFAQDTADGLPTNAPWTHVERIVCAATAFRWIDWTLPPVVSRLYLASDATRDTDADGLSDALELRVYGTSPYLKDTDGDGIDDALELAWGRNPLIAESGESFAFTETFEPPTVTNGTIDAQHDWHASVPDAAMVQTNVVHQGDNSLEVHFGPVSSGADAATSLAVTSDVQVIWIDFYSIASLGCESLSDATLDGVAISSFDFAGHPVLSDGYSFVTNTSVAIPAGRWVRQTSRLDYTDGSWDFYIDGALVAEGLALRGTSAAFHGLEIRGEGYVDDILIATARPLGLSSDGDALPDEWEFTHFCGLERDGTGDFDGDGLSDFDEWRAGTDPTIPCIDTDGDGLPDWWELRNGLDPLSSDWTTGIFFTEAFEPPQMKEGDIAGQNGWTTEGQGTAMVQSRFVRAGQGALCIASDTDEPQSAKRASHAIQTQSWVVWMELYQKASSSGLGESAMPPDAKASHFFDKYLHPVATDGYSFVTNELVAATEDAWVRCTYRFNLGTMTWDMYLDGVLVFEGLSLRGTSKTLTALELVSDGGYADDIVFSTARPEGLSSDGDDLPDEWEWRNLGSLGRDGTGDLDGDGLTDFEEYESGTNPASADTDGDGLPDAWEIDNGLDPLDASDAALDPDGDGLSNLAEFNAGTDPHLADTDGDGLPDAWELLSGTDPFVPDSLADPDGDGLVNLDEMRAGTNPLAADTDGDGVDDLFEIRNSRSNPLVADMAWGTEADIGGRVQGASASGSTGTWRTDSDGTIYAAERAGSLTWNLEVPSGGADALAVSVGQHNFYSKAATFDLSLYVDGLFVSRQVVTAPYGTSADAFFFLPEIPAGEHEFRLVWHNWAVNTFLAVYDLRFVSFGGPDVDGNGVPDWKDYRAAESSALDELPLESLVSPLCIEGRDLWRDILDVEVEYPDTNAVFATVKTIGDGFYADIPLPEDGTATISMRDRSLAESFAVTWRDFDVFGGEFATNAIVIRTGDALKIAPHDDGESEVSICRASNSGAWAAVTNWTESVSTPYVFETPGMYLVTVSREGLFGSDVGYALVDVVRSRFPKRNPAILLDAEQTLSCPQLSPRNVLEHDAELQLGAEIVGSGVTLSLMTHADRDLGLVSRIDDGGAISDAVQVTPMWADNGTYYRVADTYPDGSQLVEVSLLLGAVPEGTTVALSIFVSGVTFEDGTRTKTLTSADFDENGHCTIRFIRARGVKTSVCHSTRIYQDGKLIYKNR